MRGLFNAITVGALLLMMVGVAGADSAGGLSGANVHSPKRGGTLRLAHTSDIRSMDPTTIYDWLEGLLTMLIYNPLLDYDENDKIVPMLAEALPTISSDGSIYTFRLRAGARFSNGREVTAEDVVYSLERHLDPKFHSSYANYYQGISGAAAFTEARMKELTAAPGHQPAKSGRRIEPLTVTGMHAVDRRTIQIQLEKPDLTFSDVLATPYSVIVPREEVERWGDSFAVHPMGTGPFVLKDWKRGVRLKLVHNPISLFSAQAHVDAVEALTGIPESAQVMMFERGELDFLSAIPASDFLRLKRDPNYQLCIAEATGCNPIYISLNCEMPPFTNRLVRQALNYAVNKQQILKGIQSRGVVARGVLPNTVKGFNPLLPGYPYDPAKARMLLAEAGITNGLTVPFWILQEDQDKYQTALRVQQDLAAVGVTLELKIVSYQALLDEGQRRGHVAMSIWDWLADFNDPKDTLDFLVNGERITDDGCLNVAFYSNPRVNELFHRAAPELDRGKRLQLYQELERIVADDAPWIFLFQKNDYALRQVWLKGFTIRSHWPQRLENVWLDK